MFTLMFVLLFVMSWFFVYVHVFFVLHFISVRAHERLKFCHLWLRELLMVFCVGNSDVCRLLFLCLWFHRVSAPTFRDRLTLTEQNRTDANPHWEEVKPSQCFLLMISFILYCRHHYLLMCYRMCLFWVIFAFYNFYLFFAGGVLNYSLSGATLQAGIRLTFVALDFVLLSEAYGRRRAN